MGRLPLVDPGDVGTSSLARDSLAAAWAAQGRSVNVYRALASHPRALRKLVEFGTIVYFDNSMTPAQRELAYLTASLTNDCRY